MHVNVFQLSLRQLLRSSVLQHRLVERLLQVRRQKRARRVLVLIYLYLLQLGDLLHVPILCD